MAHKEIKHIHVCDLCNNCGKENGDEQFEEHNSFVHENGVKAFTDEEFNVLDEDQLSEIKNGPNTVRKTNLLERIKFIKEEERKQKEEERRKRREKIGQDKQ